MMQHEIDSATRYLFFTGKGGVGKRSLATATAVALADRGARVLLVSTDPASNLGQVLECDVGARSEPVPSVPRLDVLDIDPEAAAEAYRERVVGPRIVKEARRGVVVLDTAPTGHTLLLLDATGSYHREVLRTSSMPAERVVTPLMRLRDPRHTRVLIVTLPETTPVLEAEALQADLRRAGIEPHAWIINESLAAAETSDPLLRARAAAELPLIERVQQELAHRTAIVPFQGEPPVGVDRLRALTSTTATAVES